MTLKVIFNKPVDRHIEGVIKADDENSLRLELEEYVLTNEVEKRLEAFLDAYNNYEGANGAWISGFFGSGKSHLLKMLALVLENREIAGKTALDLFIAKCGENEILRGEIKRAVSIPSKSILFNIDQKADVISKTQIDALLAVFVKVLDETCGYYGKQGHIAQFERDLDSRNAYEKFKSAYEKTAGKQWTKGREQALLESKNIAKAYADATGEDETGAPGILDKYRSEYKVSIEDFAEQVFAYVERQPGDFRLNFFVDEVGQYIAGNVKLMTNLQTIAESLATRCRGRAWIIVTSQEDMSTVVGEMGEQQGNDFSKIQARFENRLKLTSADVAEVIQKRLLMKNEDGIAALSAIYHKELNNFKTLFDFADGSQTFRNYQDREHFIHSYPFIPYQFALFQSAIQNLSQHSAFEGKHSSVGERSMLGVFQQVAVHIGDHEVGQLATFDLMFEGIRTTLKANIQSAILQAEKHLGDKFAVRLLKTLFLVKYIKKFKPTVRNLRVLMLERFDQELPKLHQKIEEALSLLEQQTYIQRNGDYYEYLTDEEKDVEQEIKNTEVESSDVAEELDKLVFDHVIKKRKIRYEDNNQDYPYSRKLDGKLHGREHELAINVISPFHENVDNETTLRMQNMGLDALLVLMPPDDRLVRDLLMYKRTEKYIRQNTSVTQQETVSRILAEKGHQNRKRYDDLQTRVQDLLSKAKLLVAESAVEISTGDAQSRVIRGFNELVTRAYPNLRMLRRTTTTYTEDNIAEVLKQSDEGISGNDATSLAESEQEVLAYIQNNSRGGVRTTLKNLIEKFERKPYGWYYAAILCTVASLCARSKIELRSDGNLLEDRKVEKALTNTHKHGNVVLEPQVEFTASQVRNLKEFYEDFFDSPPGSTEAKALGKETGEAVKDLLDQLSSLSAQSDLYPFLHGLSPVLERLRKIEGKRHTWYLTELAEHKGSLLGFKEGMIDPVRKFMSGPQKEIYSQAKSFLQTQEPNFHYIEGNYVSQIQSILDDPGCFKGDRIQQLKNDLDSLKPLIDQRVKQVRSEAIDTLTLMQSRMQSMNEYKKLPDEQREELNTPYGELIEHISQQQIIAVINDQIRLFEDQRYQKVLNKMVDLSTSKDAGGQGDQANYDESQVTEPRQEYINAKNVTVNYDKAWLANEAEVDQYLHKLRAALIKEIEEGKRIQI